MKENYLEMRKEDYYHIVKLAETDDKPIFMINMLKFNDKAKYNTNNSSSENTSLTGKEAYTKYQMEVTPLLQKVGGILFWIGSVKHSFIGTKKESWDAVMIVKYPSIKNFLSMVTSKEYKIVSDHRLAALEDSRLYCVNSNFKPKF